MEAHRLGGPARTPPSRSSTRRGADRPLGPDRRGEAARSDARLRVLQGRVLRQRRRASHPRGRRRDRDRGLGTLADPAPITDAGRASRSPSSLPPSTGPSPFPLSRRKRLRSITLRADAHHLPTDVWTSIGVIVGIGLVAMTGWMRLDPLIAAAGRRQHRLDRLELVETGLALLDTALPSMSPRRPTRSRPSRSRASSFTRSARVSRAPGGSSRCTCSCPGPGRSSADTTCPRRSRPPCAASSRARMSSRISSRARIPFRGKTAGSTERKRQPGVVPDSRIVNVFAVASSSASTPSGIVDFSFVWPKTSPAMEGTPSLPS